MNIHRYTLYRIMERIVAYHHMKQLSLSPEVYTWVVSKLIEEQERFRVSIQSFSADELTRQIEWVESLMHNEHLQKDGWVEVFPHIIAMYQEALPKYKKKTIPAALKKKVWYTYIGEDQGTGMCFCCRATKIQQLSFHCGHVVSEKNGGGMNLQNMRPICQNCNSSMGTKNMNEFMAMLS